MTIKPMRPKIAFHIGNGATGVAADDKRAVVNMLQVSAKKLNRVLNRIEIESPQVLLQALVPMYLDLQSLTPVDTGALQSSAYLGINDFRNGQRVILSTGRGDPSGPPPLRPEGKSFKPTTEYVFPVHQNHPTHAGYFMHAVDSNIHNVAADIASGLHTIITSERP